MLLLIENGLSRGIRSLGDLLGTTKIIKSEMKKKYNVRKWTMRNTQPVANGDGLYQNKKGEKETVYLLKRRKGKNKNK
jgi:hypothetical protein